MELKPHHLQQFISLYEQQFGIVLTTSQAQPKLSALLSYVELCRNPVAKADENDITNMPNVSE